MSVLKNTVAAVTLAVATLAVSITGASAAERITTVREHPHSIITTTRVIHRAPERIVTRRVVERAPIAAWGGWYADAGFYHPYAYYHANPRINACFAVTQHGLSGARHAVLGATLCYGHNGAPYVTGRHVVRFL